MITFNGNVDDCFKEFKTKSSIIKNINYNDNTNLVSFKGWNIYPVDKNIWCQEPLLSLIDRYFPIENCGIIRMDANRSYIWHVDDDRGVSINLLLNGRDHSNCYFGRKVNESEDQYEIMECPYKEDVFYLFNTQVPHTVTNINMPRYLFTVQFLSQKNNLSFYDIKSFCENQNLLL